MPRNARLHGGGAGAAGAGRGRLPGPQGRHAATRVRALMWSAQRGRGACMRAVAHLETQAGAAPCQPWLRPCARCCCAWQPASCRGGTRLARVCTPVAARIAPPAASACSRCSFRRGGAELRLGAVVRKRCRATAGRVLVRAHSRVLRLRLCRTGDVGTPSSVEAGAVPWRTKPWPPRPRRQRRPWPVAAPWQTCLRRRARPRRAPAARRLRVTRRRVAQARARLAPARVPLLQRRHWHLQPAQYVAAQAVPSELPRHGRDALHDWHSGRVPGARHRCALAPWRSHGAVHACALHARARARRMRSTRRTRPVLRQPRQRSAGFRTARGRDGAARACHSAATTMVAARRSRPAACCQCIASVGFESSDMNIARGLREGLEAECKQALLLER